MYALYLSGEKTAWKHHTYDGARKFGNPLELTIFLHKFDIKPQKIFKQALKVDKSEVGIIEDNFLLSFTSEKGRDNGMPERPCPVLEVRRGEIQARYRSYCCGINTG